METAEENNVLMEVIENSIEQAGMECKYILIKILSLSLINFEPIGLVSSLMCIMCFILSNQTLITQFLIHMKYNINSHLPFNLFITMS